VRVLMLCKDCVAGGTTRHAVDLASDLAERGVEVELVMPAGGHAFEVTEVEGCRVHRTPSLGRALSTEMSPGAFWLACTRRADIVHMHIPNPVAACALSLRSRRPLVITYHCDMDRRFGLPGAMYRAALRRLMRRAATVILTSESFRESAEIRAAGARTRVIPLGVRVERLRIEARALALAETLRRRWGERVVLFVGRLVYYKGLDVLLRAARHVDARFVLVGDGPERARLEALAVDLALGTRVEFLGHQEGSPLVAAYLAASLVVLPSTGIGESFGQTQVEAALLGKPVVSTSLPTGVPWVNLHERSGLIVTPGDERALAAAFRRLLDDQEYARALGAEGRARAEREFTADVMADRTLQLYRDLVGQST